MIRSLVVLVALAALLSACAFDPSGVPYSNYATDGGTLGTDSGRMVPDGAPWPPDGAVIPPDDAAATADAAPGPTDAAPIPPDAAPIPPDATPPPDAAWTWDGIYVLNSEPTGPFVCGGWNRMRIKLTALGRVSFWSTSEPETVHSTSASVTAPNTLHLNAVTVISGVSVMNGWDATRVADGSLTGLMTFTSGCAFNIEATRLRP